MWAGSNYKRNISNILSTTKEIMKMLTRLLLLIQSFLLDGFHSFCSKGVALLIPGKRVGALWFRDYSTWRGGGPLITYVASQQRSWKSATEVTFTNLLTRITELSPSHKHYKAESKQRAPECNAHKWSQPYHCTGRADWRYFRRALTNLAHSL